MRMEWLEDFLHLADTRSFSQSAADRHVTQPAFSRRIRALGSFMSAPLVDRTTFPTTLTPAGLAFRRTAEEVIRMIERDLGEFRAQRRAAKPNICLTATHTLTCTHYPQWLSSLEQHLGPLRTRVICDDMQNCAEFLTSCQCDFMIIHTHDALPMELDPVSFPSIKLATDVLVPVSIPGEGNNPRFKVPRCSEIPVPYLSFTTEHFLGKAADLVCRQYGKPLYLDIKYENTFTDALKAMVLTGRGVAWLPESSVRVELEQGRVVKAGGPDLELPIDVRLYRSMFKTHPEVERLWQHVTGNTERNMQPL